MMLRYSIVFSVVAVMILSSCKRKEFLEDLEGKWNVTELNYIQNELITTYHPPDLTMLFMGNQYSTWQDDSLTESGSYTINVGVSQVIFWQGANQYKYKIVEYNENYQHWRREMPALSLIIDFKMDKIE